MITVYKTKKYIPSDLELIKLNDVFFNKYTYEKLDERAADVIAKIDNTEMINRASVKSKFDGATLNIDKISTGCKTALNIMYNCDKVFDIRECGDNAVDFIYSLDLGNIYCDYPLISFDMKKVFAFENNGCKEISSYDELKEWWQNEG